MRLEIEDLSHPQLNDAQKRALDVASGLGFELNSQSVLTAARAKTGLNNFGSMDFLKRLDMWLEEAKSDCGASEVAKTLVYLVCVRYAENRLRAESFIEFHPETELVEIDRPIIIAGLPRSGTTYLLGLLSANSRLRSLPWWEATAPFTLVGEPKDFGTDKDPRWIQSNRSWERIEAVLPYLSAMHEFSAGHTSEDVELQAIDFSSWLLEWIIRAPRWRDYYLSTDQTPTYSYLKRIMQALTVIRGPNRWVGKCPGHMEQLRALHSVFSDATIVITHRDPVASLQSVLTMHCYVARLLRRVVDPEEIAAYWIDRFERLLQACVRDRDSIPSDRIQDVFFEDLLSRGDVVIHNIYQTAELTFTTEARHESSAFRVNNPRGKYGRLNYRLERDFGIDPAKVRKRFQFYFERFPGVHREI